MGTTPRGSFCISVKINYYCRMKGIACAFSHAEGKGDTVNLI